MFNIDKISKFENIHLIIKHTNSYTNELFIACALKCAGWFSLIFELVSVKHKLIMF